MNNYEDINKMLSDLKFEQLPATATTTTEPVKSESESETATMNSMLRDLDLFSDRNNTFMSRDFSKKEVKVKVEVEASVEVKPNLNERLSGRDLLPTSSTYNGNEGRHNIVMESYPLSTRTISKNKNKNQ